MDGKGILDLSTDIIARSDVNRPMLLNFINTSTKAAFRARSVYRMQGVRQFDVTANIVPCPNLKLARYVRWYDDDLKSELVKIPDVKVLLETYADPSRSGNPAQYIILGQSIQIVPAATHGTLLVAGEFWPDALADSANSNNLLSDEIPDFLMYYGVAEYMDFLQEENRGQVFRTKALGILGEWLKENHLQEMTETNNMPRDPLGNLGHKRYLQTETDNTEVIDDAGVW